MKAKTGEGYYIKKAVQQILPSVTAEVIREDVGERMKTMSCTRAAVWARSQAETKGEQAK